MASFVGSQIPFLPSLALIIPVFQITFFTRFNLWYQNCYTFVLLCGTNIKQNRRTKQTNNTKLYVLFVI